MFDFSGRGSVSLMGSSCNREFMGPVGWGVTEMTNGVADLWWLKRMPIPVFYLRLQLLQVQSVPLCAGYSNTATDLESWEEFSR